ncbi:MAG: divergent polysaccharide deacetylase family protein [Rhodospirillales bacterium]|nr:divergent polysaccharide deacetylase family protein [Alphaproteobacteria bacterium]MBL6947822.1 divergent polysaccharide deacetylase family protein [Rhodospirillales bacterium]
MKTSGKDKRKPIEPRQSAARRPEFRLNPKRQAFFVLIALAGIAIGYGLGLVTKDPVGPKETATKARAVLQELPSNGKSETAPAPARVRVYEEPLPKDIIENPILDENGNPLPTLKVTVETAYPAPQIKQPPEPVTAPLEKAETSSTPPIPPKTPEEKPKPEQLAVAPMVVPDTGRKPRLKMSPEKRPKIAIVLDDLGIDKSRTARAIKLKGPLTMSFLTYASGLAKQTKAARDAGHELWMHIPMEPGSPDIDPGPNVLLTGLPEEELLTSIRWNLDQFSGYAGINNHMGSRFTADLAGLRVVMGELKKRDLKFLDSITSGRTVARKAAREAGVPFLGRNIFIDHLDETAEIEKRLAEVERLAMKSGFAVAIGHPREKTLRTIGPWLEGVEEKGFRLVPLSTLYKRP